MENFSAIVEQVSAILWGWPMIILLLGTHLYLTVILKFPQRKIFKAIRLSVVKDKSGSGDVSQFGALATSLAATIGTENIVGVATAVALGGPGAVFWCWITVVFGIATKYSEGLLAIKYRVKTTDGTMLGGPMYALEKGLKMKWLAILFCIFTAIAAFGIGNTVQANSIALLINETYSISPYITGLVLSFATALVILFGVKGTAKVCGTLVPFMAFFYILGCLVILYVNSEYLLRALDLIVDSAFSAKAAGGGFVGTTIMMAARFGIARGLFSNESGLGSAPIVAAAAQTRNPVRQALVSSTGTFWDTVVVCLMTGLVIVSAGDWQSGLKGAALTRSAFSHIPYIGPTVLSLGLLTFVFSTILGWEYYGEKAAEYLLGIKAVKPYRYMWIAAVMVGSVGALPAVWNFADIFNGLMAVPNLISLLLLAPVVAAETKKYIKEP